MTFRPLVIVATFACAAAGVRPADAEWVVAGYFGAAHTAAAPLSLSQPAIDTNTTFAFVEYEGKSFSSPVYYGYRVAYFLPHLEFLGVEGELIHSKAYARTDGVTRMAGRLQGAPIDREGPISDVLEQFSISHGLNLALVNVVARRRLASNASGSRVTLLGRVGIGPTIPHAESQIGGTSREGYELGALAFQAAGGMDVRLVRGLSAIGEYKFTTTDQRVAVVDGHAEGRFTSHHGVVGLAWHF